MAKLCVKGNIGITRLCVKGAAGIVKLSISRPGRLRAGRLPAGLTLNGR